MKRLSLLFCLLLLAGCSTPTSNEPASNNGSNNPPSDGGNPSDGGGTPEDDTVEVGIKDGAILHAWGWTTQMVMDELDNIKNAGYRSVQLSPMQPSKDRSPSARWWNVYQPQGFVVATGDESPFGNKESLRALTTAAEEKGISIIMDVITNHLGGNNEHQFDDNVINYERYIVENDLKHNNGKVSDWNNRYQVVTRAMGGYPDILTNNEHVQGRIISMLNEYLDLGVKGFRFDAAKSIETPDDDSSCRSDYWPNVINAINAHGIEVNGEKPYVYGELLDNPCIQYEAYTKYMAITDNRQGNTVRGGVVYNNVGNAASSGYYNDNPSTNVLWAESHDTYANEDGPTYGLSENKMNLTYAIQIARKDATALYFVRPEHKYSEWGKHYDLQVTDGYKVDFKSPLVAAANKLHNDFIGGSETISTSDSAVINVRKRNNHEGALIADINCSNSQKTVNVNPLSNGVYVDLITNQNYTVQDGSVTVNLTDGACVLEKKADSQTPLIRITPDKTLFSDSTNVTITVTNGTNSSYKINNGSPINFSNSVTFSVGSALAEGSIEIEATSSNANGESTERITLVKSSQADKNFIVTNVPSDYKLAIWSWNQTSDSSWVVMEGSGTIRGANLSKANYVIAVFNSDAEVDWGNKVAQTGDLTRDGLVIKDFAQLFPTLV